MGLSRRSRLIVLGTALRLPFALAVDSDVPCPSPSGGPFPEIASHISRVIAPLKQEYLDLNRFELDPLSADLASLENQVDPPEKRKTITYKVRTSIGSKVTLSPSALPYLDLQAIARWTADGETVSLRSQQQETVGRMYGIATPPPLTLKASNIRELNFEELRDSVGSRLPYSSEEMSHASLTGEFPSAAPTGDRLSQANVFATYLSIVSQKDRAGIESTLASIAPKLSTNEKIQVARMVGDVAGDYYDFRRAGDKYAQEGASAAYGKTIPYDAILTNLRQGKRLGVCRDIAVAQAQVLSRLGFSKTYGLAYDSGVNHAAVIAQNPDNPKEILHFNYGALETGQSNLGIRSLTRGRDFSTSYHVFDASGKSVANLPSELGTVMAEGSGANLKTLDPFLTRPEGSIAQLSFEGKKGRIPIFVGRTSSGDEVAGVGYRFSRGDPEQKGISYASNTAVGLQKTHPVPWGDKTISYEAAHIMSIATVQAATPWKNVSTTAKGTRTDVRVTGTVNLTGDGSTTKGALGGSGTANTEVGVEGKLQTADEKTKVTGRIATQYGLGTRDLSGAPFTYVYRNVTYAKLSGETVVLPERMKATLDAAVGLREFGPQILVEGGVKDVNGKWKASAGYQGALEKDAFAIAPGMERELNLSVERDLGRSVTLNATYLQPTGYSFDQGRAQLGVNGSLTEMLRKKKSVRRAN